MIGELEKGLWRSKVAFKRSAQRNTSRRPQGSGYGGGGQQPLQLCASVVSDFHMRKHSGLRNPAFETTGQRRSSLTGNI